MSILLGRSHSAPETVGAPRKRVARACVQCRLKKTKCDASYPCRKCREDDRTCSYALQTKLRKKERPKGYTELLENDYIRIVAGLKESYRRLQEVDAWPGPPLPEQHGKIAVHDILEALGVRNMSRDDTDEQPEIVLPCPKCQTNLVPGAGEGEPDTALTEDSNDVHSFGDWEFADDSMSLTSPGLQAPEGQPHAGAAQDIGAQDRAAPDFTFSPSVCQPDPTNWLNLAPDYAHSSWTPGHMTLQHVQQTAWAAYGAGSL